MAEEMICVICKVRLNLNAPESGDEEDDESQQQEVVTDENLKGHQTCRTKCGHLVHTTCLSRQLQNESPRCPTCSAELKPGEATPEGSPPNNCGDGSGDAPTSSMSGIRRTSSSANLGNNNDDASQPKQPRLGNNATDDGNVNGQESRSSVASVAPAAPPPPLPPNTGFFSIFEELPQGTVLRLLELRRQLNQDGLMDRFDSRLTELLPRINTLTEDQWLSVAQSIAVRTIHWLIGVDRDVARESIQSTHDRLEQLQNWLNQQHFGNPDPTVVRQPQAPQAPQAPAQHEISFWQTGQILWAVGPISLCRLTWLFSSINNGTGLVDSTMERIQDCGTRIIQILRNPENVNRMIAAFGNWMLEQDPETLRQHIRNSNDRMQQLLEYLNEEGF